MVPTSFVLLDSLPLTASGKLNRRALPQPDDFASTEPKTFAPPQTPVEASLAAIWADLLGVHQVSVNDNFFELGGHSLVATRVMSRVSDTFEIRVLLRDFFEQPTVAGLAELVSDAKKEHRETIPSIRRLPRA
jgi:acyl carrier protein